MENFTGQQFGNYRLIRHLGTGGFGKVYLGQHIHIQREAAIKMLLKLEPDEIEQFRQEAQIIANLTHPRIVTIFDYDVAGETPFIVMQYAEQGTLRGRYRRGAQVPLAEVVKYITQAAEALQFAHDHRIVHRDIKPENMLLGPNGDLLLSDFGIAVVWSSTRSVGVQNSSGTLAYMPPEQILKHPRAASDQYSLAVTAYEWLSGERPLAGSKMGLGMVQAQYPEMKAPSLRQTLPHLPQQVDDVLQRALAGDWQARFPTVRDFAQELERAASAASSVLTQYASLPTQEVLSPVQYALPPQSQYAPPPPVSYQFAPGMPSYTPAPPVYMVQPQQTRSKALSVIGKIFSIIGMITGIVFALIGILGSFMAGEGLYADIWVGDIICFFGLLIFFLARMRRSPYPVPRARKIEAAIGMYIGMIAIVLGAIITIFGIATITPSNGHDGGIVGGILSIMEGIGIWLLTRTRIKKPS